MAVGTGNMGGGGQVWYRGHSWQKCEGCLPSWGADPIEREMGPGEVKGTLTLPNQAECCHVKECRSIALMSSDDARDPGVSVDPCHQSDSAKVTFNLYI